MAGVLWKIPTTERRKKNVRSAIFNVTYKRKILHNVGNVQCRNRRVDFFPFYYEVSWRRGKKKLSCARPPIVPFDSSSPLKQPSDLLETFVFFCQPSRPY